MNATDVECPECGAAIGERCRTMTGKALPVTHAKRKYAAFAAEASAGNAVGSPFKSVDDTVE